jgi:ATP-dependent RNA helicase DeaD
MPVIYKKLAWLEREELIKHFVSVEFNRFLQYYENAPDINVNESHFSGRDYESAERGKRSARGKKERSESPGRNTRSDRGGKKRGGYEFSRFFFNLGKKDGINKRTIIDLVNQHLSEKSVEIGDIEVMKNFSFFEVDQRFEKQILKTFQNASYKGKRMSIDIAKGK